MTKRFFMVVPALGLVLAMVALSAPAQAAEIRARVPFGFSVQGKTLPAGTYTININGAGLLSVRSFNGGAVVLTRPLESAGEGGARLIFHKYGESYVLREAWMNGSSGRELPESRQEREARAAHGGKVASFERVEIPLL